MEKQLLLGIDIGTSGCKISVFQADGRVVAECAEPYPTRYDGLGQAEQDATDWWLAVSRGIKDLIRSFVVNPAEFVAIGVAGQSWSCLPVDRRGEPLRRAMIWLDRRAREQARRMRDQFGEDYLVRLSGNPVDPAYIVPKILWLKDHEPEIYRQTTQFLQSNAYIVFKLTGAYSQDLSQGYGFHFFDVARGRYDQGVIDGLGLESDRFAPVYRCNQIVGRVTPEAAAATGLIPGIPVVAGGLDAACSTLGAGVVRSGQTQEQGGQAGGMSIQMAQPRFHPRLIMGQHVIPGQWLLQGGTVGGSGALKWFNEQLGAAEQQLGAELGQSAFAIMSDEAGRVRPGADGLIFLPYLAGERSPVWDSRARGVFFGLSYAKTRAHLIRAVMEGVGFALHHNLATAAETGAEVGALNSVGGASNSEVWCQIKADITGKPLRVPYSDQATTLGAALVAGVGVGLYPDFESAVSRTVRFQRAYTPDPERHRLYQSYFSLYLELYQRLKDCYGTLARISGESNDNSEV